MLHFHSLRAAEEKDNICFFLRESDNEKWLGHF
jgi:hypothetical protein